MNRLKNIGLLIVALSLINCINSDEIIKHQYHSLNNAKSFDQFKINDLIVSSDVHNYWTERNGFTMPYEIHINKDYQVKANIEAGQNYSLEYTITDYAGGYEFILEPRDVKFYLMIQSKLSEEKLKTDSARVNGNGHQIVVNNTIVNNNPKTIYYNRDYSSLIMFTDYLILKYIL